MKKPKKNKWYTFDGPIKPKPNTGGIIGITDMGCIFELFYTKEGEWEEILDEMIHHLEMMDSQAQFQQMLAHIMLKQL